MLVVRLLILLLGTSLGWLAGQTLTSVQPDDLSRLNTLSLALAGLLITTLLLPRLERLIGVGVVHFSRWYSSLAPRTVAAATFGLIIALLVSVLLGSLLRGLPFYNWIWSVVITLGLAFFFVSFAANHSDAFGLLAFPQVRRKPGSKLLDSNVIIDGRIIDLARAGFLEGELVVPGFILRELQTLSDNADMQKRTRGKRGLAVLEEIRELRTILIEDWDDINIPNVDDKLIRLARDTGGKIITNDGNLSKIAKLHGVEVLSIHEAAVALKPQVQAGDQMVVTITKSGQQQGQGVGYMEDGTMVVVDEGLKFKGKPARILVVNNVQTSIGRMIFAKLDKEAEKEEAALSTANARS